MTTEKSAVRKLIKIGLAKGYTASVHDGEEWTVLRSTKLTDIIEALMTTDEDALRFHDDEGKKFCTFYLVYGNSPEEVICNHTDNLMASEIYNEWEKVVV